MSRDYHKTSRHKGPSTTTSTCLSADDPTTSGNAARADTESDGSTTSARTTGSPQRICGGVRLLVVTEEQRYSPCWRRENDDDEHSSTVGHNRMMATGFSTEGWVVGLHQRHLCGRAWRRSTYIFDVKSASRSWDVAITRDIQLVARFQHGVSTKSI